MLKDNTATLFDVCYIAQEGLWGQNILQSVDWFCYVSAHNQFVFTLENLYKTQDLNEYTYNLAGTPSGR